MSSLGTLQNLLLIKVHSACAIPAGKYVPRRQRWVMHYTTLHTIWSFAKCGLCHFTKSYDGFSNRDQLIHLSSEGYSKFRFVEVAQSICRINRIDTISESSTWSYWRGKPKCSRSIAFWRSFSTKKRLIISSVTRTLQELFCPGKAVTPVFLLVCKSDIAFRKPARSFHNTDRQQTRQ